MDWRGILPSGGFAGLRGARAGAATCVAAVALFACSTVDPYDLTCAELISSPDRLREATLKMAKDDVQAKVNYQSEIERICAEAPPSFKPAQQVKPEE